ncbi:hypothetical protein M758_UG163700 [Ceratodon purpureus]|nr:hypothetical protein M758_UG163700 [Ceratodon purpureus]
MQMPCQVEEHFDRTPFSCRLGGSLPDFRVIIPHNSQPGVRCPSFTSSTTLRRYFPQGLRLSILLYRQVTAGFLPLRLLRVKLDQLETSSSGCSTSAGGVPCMSTTSAAGVFSTFPGLTKYPNQLFPHSSALWPPWTQHLEIPVMYLILREQPEAN